MRIARLGSLAGLWLMVLIAVGCAGAAGPAATAAGRDGNSGGPVAAPDVPAEGEQPAASPGTPSQVIGDPNQLVVYNGTMTLEVSDLRPALDQAELTIVGMGGHLAGSSLEASSSGGEYATVTYRIPAARWSEALQALRALGSRVVTESTDSQDVTTQVVDIDARISNLRVTEAAFQTFMERATTIDEVLKVQRELTTVRGDIERLTAERDTLSNRAALGTLSVRFQVPLVETTRVSDGWDLGREIDTAVASLVRMGQGLTSLGVWVMIVVLPVLAPVLVLGYVALRLRRRWLETHPRAAPAYAAAGAPKPPPPGPYMPDA